MSTINLQSLKYVNTYCTSKQNPKIKMAAVYDHFRNFQPQTSISTKMTNDKKKNSYVKWC